MSEHRRKPPQSNGGGRAAGRRASSPPSSRRSAAPRGARGSDDGPRAAGSHAHRDAGPPRPSGGRAEARRAAQARPAAAGPPRRGVRTARAAARPPEHGQKRLSTTRAGARTAGAAGCRRGSSAWASASASAAPWWRWSGSPYAMVGIPERQRRRGLAEERLLLGRRQPHGGLRRRRLQPPGRAVRPDPQVHAGRGDLGGERDVLDRLRHRPEGHRARRGEDGRGRRDAERLDHHPAVREELLPGPEPDDQPQAQGDADLRQGGRRGLQAEDPRRLPEHRLLRPRRLRHPGRLAGVLRDQLLAARPVAERLPGRACSTDPTSTTRPAAPVRAPRRPRTSSAARPAGRGSSTGRSPPAT